MALIEKNMRRRSPAEHFGEMLGDLLIEFSSDKQHELYWRCRQIILEQQQASRPRESDARVRDDPNQAGPSTSSFTDEGAGPSTSSFTDEGFLTGGRRRSLSTMDILGPIFGAQPLSQDSAPSHYTNM